MAVLYLYTKFAASLNGGETAGESRLNDWLSDDIRLMLCSSSYVPNRDTHEFKSDITNELPTAGGYVANGASLAGKTITVDAANHRVIFDANDVVWAAATFTARYGVLYNRRAGADVDRELIGYVDFEADKAVAGVDFQVIWSANGIYRMTVP